MVLKFFGGKSLSVSGIFALLDTFALMIFISGKSQSPVFSVYTGLQAISAQFLFHLFCAVFNYNKKNNNLPI